MIFHQHFHCFNSKHSPNTCVISQHTIPIAPKTFGRCYKFCWLQVAGGKTTSWPELEITGTIKNLSPALWRLQHLTALYLNDNSLFRIPPSISLLQVSFYSAPFWKTILKKSQMPPSFRISNGWTCPTTNYALYLQKLGTFTGSQSLYKVWSALLF